eukprot:scpid46201/ scgid22946/ Long-chain-fatty-acid--CoA ligase ACSBG2; Acyl-CoA synthetase bubblegum family member 2
MKTDHSCTEIDGCVPIKVGEKGIEAAEPITIHQVFKNTVSLHGDQPALVEYKGDEKHVITYQQYYDQCRCAAKSLMHFGVKQGVAVSIIGFNSSEWFISDLASILTGGVASGIYSTNSPQACQFIIEDSSTGVVIVENAHQLGKILQILDSCSKVKAIVQYKGEVKEEQKRDNVFTWTDFLEQGKDVTDADLDERIEAQKPENVCTLIYTSGTTGNPKAVMVTHDNITWTGRALAATADVSHTDRIITYLPLSHVAAQVNDIHSPLSVGASVHFAQPDALKGSLRKTLHAVHPTLFLGVPRVWEKIEVGLRSQMDATGGVKGAIGRWARGIGLEGGYSKQKGGETPFGWWFANKMVFETIKQKMGLDECRGMYTAAAPISKSTLEFFLSVGIPIFEVYGMSECTGPQTISREGMHRLGSCGAKMNGTEMKILSPDEDGNGEICYRGRHIFLGYLNNEEKTREAVDEEGWLHSGDIGKVDEDGFLHITGRLKELLITAGGENVAPVPIENKMKEVMPLLSNVMVIGDKQRFLSMLVTLKVKLNEEGNPTSDLADDVKPVLQSIGSAATTVEEAQKCDKIRQYLEDGRVEANKFAVSNAQKIQKFVILPVDFSVNGGEITETLKLKRNIVAKRYDDIICQIYAEAAPPAGAAAAAASN